MCVFPSEWEFLSECLSSPRLKGASARGASAAPCASRARFPLAAIDRRGRLTGFGGPENSGEGAAPSRCRGNPTLPRSFPHESHDMISSWRLHPRNRFHWRGHLEGPGDGATEATPRPRRQPPGGQGHAEGAPVAQIKQKTCAAGVIELPCTLLITVSAQPGIGGGEETAISPLLYEN